MRYVQHRSFDIRPPPANPQRRTYLGITGVLLVIVLALAGGIIWYNTKKSNQLVVAAADRMIEEVGEHVSDRLKLIYDPMYVIIGTASLMPELTSPSIAEDPRALSLIRRVLSVYPQILSLYVGFDSGDFFMVTHVAGENSKELTAALKAPQETAFASEIISTNAGGERKVRWVFLRADGSVVGSSDPVPSEFDPRQRPWYDIAKDSEEVEQSELYVFASSGEPGFTLSRGFKGQSPGVVGADFAAIDLSRFLRNQRLTPNSTAFIFTKAGKVIALPDATRIAKAVHSDGQVLVEPPKVGLLADSVIAGLVATYEDGRMSGIRIYDVAGRTYVGDVVEIPPRYGRDQLLAIMVPLDEIEKPVIEIRNQTLIYSIVFLLFAMPLYVTLVIAWIDRRLHGRFFWPGSRED
jgi:adenylate cyclase